MSRGKPFVELSPTDQDSVLIDVETGAATGSGAGFAGSSAQFFAMVLNHTRQGMFGDPYYGGNANFVGWDLIGYPGVRTSVTAADQQALEATQLKPNHSSAYDNERFNKATASARACARRSAPWRLGSRTPTSSSSGMGAAGGVAALPLAQAGIEVDRPRSRARG